MPSLIRLWSSVDVRRLGSVVAGLLLTGLLSACGSGAVGGGSGSGGTGGGVPTLTLTLTETNGTGTRTSVSPGNPARANATFRNAAGNPITGVVISFTTDATLGVIAPSAGTAITDANGVASVTLSSSTASGAAVLTATGQTTLAGSSTPTTVTGTLNYTATGGAAPPPTLSVTLSDPTTGATRTSITPTSPARVSATFRTGAGAPITGVVVSFTTDATLGLFTPSAGTAITDANGVASVTLNSSTASGAGVVSATAQTTLPGATTPTPFTNTVAYTATGGPPPSPTITVALLDVSTGASRSSISPTAPARVSATFRTGAGVPIAGAVITFSTDAAYGVLEPATGTALTDANGVASVIMRAATASGAATITASGQTTPTGATAPLTFNGSVAYSATGSPAGAATLNLSMVDPISGAARATISPTNSARVTATFRTASGVPISGAVITFTTDATLGRFDPAIGTALTDANGVASILLIASTGSGAGTVTATGQTAASGSTTTGTVTGTISFSATGAAASQPTLTLALTELTSNAIRTSVAPGNPARVVATLRSATGAPISGVILTFTTEAGFGTFNPTSATALTDANGVATMTLQSATTSGAALVRASGQPTLPGTSTTVQVTGTVPYSATGGSTAQPTIEVTFSEPKAGIAANASAWEKAAATAKQFVSDVWAKALTLVNPKFRTITPVAPAQVNATFRTGAGAPIAGAVITFATDTAYGTFTPASGTALTDANGVASVLMSSSTTAGAATVTATGQTTVPGATAVSTITGSATYTATGATVNLPTLTVTLVDASTGAPRTAITAANPGRVVATFRNGAGAPIAGAVVTFATDAAYGTIDPASGTALTDANGVATVGLFASSTTGAATITARAQTTVPPQTTPTTFTGSTSFSATGVQASSATMVATLTDPATGAARSSVAPDSPARVNAVLRTGGGAPVAGAVVTFTTDATLGSFVPANGTALTDATGTAFVLLYPSTASGAGRVTATTQTILPGSTIATTITGGVNYATSAAAVLSLTMNDPATGAVRTSVSSGNPARLTASVRQTSGAPAVGAVVTFTTDSTLGIFTPASGTALTDASGVASILINAASLTAAGAARATATAQIGSGTTTAVATTSLGYSVGAANVTMSPVVIATPVLSAFGTTGVSVTVSAGGVPVSAPLTVSFTSPCASGGRAALTSSVSTSNGVASATYRDIGCAGADTITATISGLAISATGSLTVAAPAVGSIQFVAASPTSIALRGTGGAGRQETSQVSFRVVDVAGNPLGGRAVTFTLNTAVGGMSLSTNSATSDPSTGLVVTTVQAGTVSTPIRVTASTVAGTQTLSTQSDQLTVSTGVPSQDGFSLSVSTLNIEGFDADGTTTRLTARLADRFRNPVPDGTVVNFTAGGGSVGSSCATVSGVCSVTMTSQNIRPNNGRVAFLGYAIGEEAFTDLNGSGWFDISPVTELVDVNGASSDMPEAWLDLNENGLRDANEPFIDFNSNNAYDAGDGKFNGVSCDDSVSGRSSAGSCSATKSIHVRGQGVVVFSGSSAVVTPSSSTVAFTPCTTTAAYIQPAAVDLSFTVVDARENVMPAGTTISFVTSNGTIASTPTTFTVPNSTCSTSTCGGTNNGVTTFGVTIRADASQTSTTDAGVTTRTCTNPASSGNLTVTVTTPSGRVTTRTVSVTD